MPHPVRAFGFNLYEVGLIGAGFFGLTGIVFLLFKSKTRQHAGGAMLALSGFLTVTGTKLLPLDKLVEIKKIFGVDTLLSVNIGRRLQESSITAPASQTQLIHVQETVEGFATGKFTLPSHEVIDRILARGTPVAVIIIGRADRRELRGKLILEHGSNSRLAERRAAEVAKLFSVGEVVTGVSLPKIMDGEPTDEHLKPDRSVNVHAFFIAQVGPPILGTSHSP